MGLRGRRWSFMVRSVEARGWGMRDIRMLWSKLVFSYHSQCLGQHAGLKTGNKLPWQKERLGQARIRSCCATLSINTPSSHNPSIPTRPRPLTPDWGGGRAGQLIFNNNPRSLKPSPTCQSWHRVHAQEDLRLRTRFVAAVDQNLTPRQ